MPKYHKGRFKPNNPEKYRGDPTNIIYRSSWELKFLRYLDKHPDVIWYASEEVIVPYISPLDGKKHRYFPDFIVRRKKRDGTVGTVMIEVKPKKQTMPPKPETKKTKTGRQSVRFIREARTYSVNKAKWIAARAYCRKKGWDFEIMTEDHLGIKR